MKFMKLAGTILSLVVFLAAAAIRYQYLYEKKSNDRPISRSDRQSLEYKAVGFVQDVQYLIGRGSASETDHAVPNVISQPANVQENPFGENPGTEH